MVSEAPKPFNRETIIETYQPRVEAFAYRNDSLHKGETRELVTFRDTGGRILYSVPLEVYKKLKLGPMPRTGRRG